MSELVGYYRLIILTDNGHWFHLPDSYGSIVSANKAIAKEPASLRKSIRIAYFEVADWKGPIRRCVFEPFGSALVEE